MKIVIFLCTYLSIGCLPRVRYVLTLGRWVRGGHILNISLISHASPFINTSHLHNFSFSDSDICGETSPFMCLVYLLVTTNFEDCHFCLCMYLSIGCLPRVRYVLTLGRWVRGGCILNISLISHASPFINTSNLHNFSFSDSDICGETSPFMCSVYLLVTTNFEDCHFCLCTYLSVSCLPRVRHVLTLGRWVRGGCILNISLISHAFAIYKH